MTSVEMRGDASAEPGTVRRFRAELPALLADIERLVCCESPSTDLAAVARGADAVAAIGGALLGVAPERIVLSGRTHLRWRFGGPARVLVLGHHDTVWPVGSVRTHPFAVRDGKLYGPGCFDMKAGLALALRAVAALPDRSGVTILVTGDEELGAPSSRELVVDTARGCAAVLVAEPAAGTALKIVRKGVSHYRIRVRGRAAHAGLEPERGVNATDELAHQIGIVAALGDAAVGTSVTPTLMSAGTAANTVPAEASCAVDVRAATVAEQDRVDAAMRGLRPLLDGAELEVLGGPNRPPLAAESSRELFSRAQRLGAALGIGPITGAAVSGGSDGNLTAGSGIPTLDGLGACGDGAHADHEHVLIDELPGRAALFHVLLEELLGVRESTSIQKGRTT
ncbi:MULTISPECIES: M20/M25/M40 family metallo-hydrolase [unclassified Nocardia]|uniref:M20/M25/M40 family metallo-hydrolase n=1 Tax=unclassified Nocardia TaxID=2637762 RepID=UPI001CE46F6B|nr:MULTISPECIES: M20/M25/M40 family metallo-hydrolase [unclassified Nocardia]